MNIGIDIDNTITNTREIILDYIHKFDQENNLNTQMDLSQYSLEASLRWDAQLIQRFLNTYLADIYSNVRPKPHAIEVIEELHQCHSIILITSRNQRDQSVTTSTLEWLSKYRLSYDRLVMNNTENMHHFSKLAACLENDIDLMIEDHHDLSLELSHLIPVLMFDYPYNNHLDVTNITRVQDWRQIKTIIKGLAK